MMVTG